MTALAQSTQQPLHRQQTAPHRRLAFEGVSKSFGVVRALEDVSFDLDGGEILALMGENGAGKSTLLNILSGALAPDKGSVVLDGQVYRFRSPLDARRSGIRVVHQEPDILGDVSVAENLFIGELPRDGMRRVDWKLLNTQAEELLSRFRVGSLIDPRKPAANLTAARRQIVEILRAMRARSTVLALDEPTSSLSEAEAQDLFTLVRQLRTDGVGLIYVSHRMAEILDLCDRVAVLRDGAFVGAEAAADLNERKIVSMMVGRTLDQGMRSGRYGSDTPVLNVRGLTNEWVNGIDLTIHRGEIVGLSGLIGAGRTELAKTIFGDYAARAGTIEIDGRVVHVRSPSDAIANGIVYVPEERKTEGIFPELSVLRNGSVAILRSISPYRIVDARKERAIVSDMAGKLAVKTPSMEQSIRKLSGGNQQKLVLARWLATRPSVMILDEPTRGIDVGAKAEIYRIIDELAAQGTAILLISSEMNEVLGLSDRIVCMRNGAFSAQFAAAEADEESLLRAIMPEFA